MSDTAGGTDEQDETTTEGASRTPFLRVVHGSPNESELAAVVAVLSAAASAGGDSDEPAPQDQWSAPTRMHRATVAPGPQGWWASSLPR